MPAKPLRLGVVMDPIKSITPKKDSSFAMLLEASRRGAAIYYFELRDLRLAGGVALGNARLLQVQDDAENWYSLGAAEDLALGDLDVILMRKDPPFNMEYIYSTYILERAADAGALVVNSPGSLRDMNEKAYTAWFADCAPMTLITRSMADLKDFLRDHQHVVIKPLDGMGGRSIFVIKKGDNNANVVFETLTDNGQRFAMAQTFIPEINKGDKRILLIDGEPVPYALARIPPADDNRGNLVMGATAEGLELSERDRFICSRVGPRLKEGGVVFAGIDVIGDYLTEINVTSPTGIRELDRMFDLNIAGKLFDAIDARLA
ncbi:MAG: glutathione synthase [Woeseia sp.]|nr:glutathione synthase [Woeseia sp.]MBT8096546.1 glutathione synthase [Woeseia sp.]NNE61693.1 glutathione synthase [Woeseia sp.]NNL53836.1 glutathione synthase [Woeseia sp.]